MVKKIHEHLLFFKWEIIPAASVGEGCPCVDDWRWTGVLSWALPPEELLGVEGCENEIGIDGGFQGISWKFDWGGACEAPLQTNSANFKNKIIII